MIDFKNLKPGDKWVRVKHDPHKHRTIVLLFEIVARKGDGLAVRKSCLQDDGSWKVLAEGEKQTPIADVFVAGPSILDEMFCVVCGEPASFIVQDLKKFQNVELGMVEYETDGAVLTFCEEHHRESRIRDMGVRPALGSPESEGE